MLRNGQFSCFNNTSLSWFLFIIATSFFNISLQILKSFAENEFAGLFSVPGFLSTE